jgi:hypothetical protein
MVPGCLERTKLAGRQWDTRRNIRDRNRRFSMLLSLAARRRFVGATLQHFLQHHILLQAYGERSGKALAFKMPARANSEAIRGRRMFEGNAKGFTDRQKR